MALGQHGSLNFENLNWQKAKSILSQIQSDPVYKLAYLLPSGWLVQMITEYAYLRAKWRGKGMFKVLIDSIYEEVSKRQRKRVN